MSKKSNLQDTIDMLDAKISHVEDATMDNRKLMIKLVKQGNEIVKFLREIDFRVEDAMEMEQELIISSPTISIGNTEQMNKTLELKELLDMYVEKHQDLKEFEEEMKKHKDMVIPGLIGES